MQIDVKQQWRRRRNRQHRRCCADITQDRAIATAEALPTATAAGGGQASLVQFSFFLNLQHANQTYQS